MAKAATTTAGAAKDTKSASNGIAKRKGPKGKNSKARTAMVKMQSFFKENRAKYSHLEFKEQQKELGKEWKTSSQNPKNAA